MKAKNLLSLPIISVLFTILVSFFIYKSSINSYFFQDDWFTLKISNAKTVPAFFQFFIPRQDIIYYRPLGMQLPFFVLQNVFGINPLAFHILTFITHSINIILVFLLIRLLVGDAKVAIFAALFYGTSAVHYTLFFWPATYAFVLGPTVFLLSFILFLRKKQKKLYYLSIIVYTLGLFVNEIVIVLPLILFIYQLLYKKLKEFKLTVPYFLLGFAYSLLRFIVFAPPTSGYYKLGVGKELFVNFRAYLLWSYNWPEEMKAQFINFFKINPLFIKDFPWFFWIFTISLFINLVLFYIIPLVMLFIKREMHFLQIALFSVSWFSIALLPVIFFPRHTFSYYLPISLVGLLFISSYLFKYFIETTWKYSRLLAFLIVVIMTANWLFSSSATVDFNEKIHWAPRRAKLARILVEETKRGNPLPLKDMVFVGDLSENKLALNDQDAFKVIYNNDHIVTIYGD